MSFAANPSHQMLAEGRRSLRPEDIKAYGVQRFLDEQAQRGPLQLPKLHFTDEENRLMNELLEEERTASFSTTAGRENIIAEGTV